MKKYFKLLSVVFCSAIFSRCEKDPIPCFTMSATNAFVGETVTFTDCSTRAKHQWFDKANPAIYDWDFGDGHTGNGASAMHIYASAGAFIVTLKVQDKDKDKFAVTRQSITIIKRDISRSGKFVAFTSDLDGDYDIYLAQVDANGNFATSNLIFGTNPYNLTNSFNTLADREPNWSPSGRILIFSSRRATGEENIYAFFFNSNGTLVSPSPSLVISQTAVWDDNAGFSPDSTKIIFDRRKDQNANGLDSADNRDLYVAAITSGPNSITVNSVIQITNTSNIDEGNPKWSPVISVGRVAYERPPTPTANDHDIYIVDPMNPSATNYDWNNPGSSGYPAWAPDCASITFETNSGNGGFYKIVYASYPNNTGTTDLVKSSSQDYRYPTRLPNGNLTAYIQVDPVTFKGNIYVVPATGGTSVKLLPSSFDNADNTYPAW